METVVNRGFRGEVIEPIDFYNLDAIISVGYRVNSRKATHFRIWATGVLKEYITKGFAMDDHFNKTQKIDSDFEKQIKKLLEKGNKE